ncbi:hypothetical protein ACXYMO_12045 [Arenibacterium sp. CAU 1754]
MSRAVADFTFERQGRSRRAILALAAAYAVLFAAWWFLDAAPWLIGAIGLFTLPALWEVLANPAAGLRLTQDRVIWHSGRRGGDLRLEDIDHVRLDTRWDFSVRTSAVLTSDKRIRLPDECLPPHRALEMQLKARNIRTERHHFSFF